MSRNGQRRFATTSDVILKSVVALFTGAIAYAVTNLSHEPTIWTLTLSAFIGGVVLIVQFLIEFEQRLEGVEKQVVEHAVAMTSLVERRLGEISDVVELVERSITRVDVIEFLQNAVNIDDGSPLLFDFAHEEIRRVSRFLKEVNDGMASYFGEDRDWLFGLTRSARTSIDATSLATVDAGGQGFEDGFWDTDIGRRYLELQRAATERGVRVRRIFMPNDSGGDESAFHEMCALHASFGVDVHVLRSDAVPPQLQNALFDFILFDDTISYQVTPAARVPSAANRPTIINTTLVRRPDMVEINKSHFNALWAASEPLTPVPVPPE